MVESALRRDCPAPQQAHAPQRLSSGCGRRAGDSAVQVAQLPPVLAEVHYHMRLKGFMRPRKCALNLVVVPRAKATPCQWCWHNCFHLEACGPEALRHPWSSVSSKARHMPVWTRLPLLIAAGQC